MASRLVMFLASAVATFALLLLLPSSSRAETAVMQPLPSELEGTPAANEAQQAVRTALASANIEIVSDDEAKARLVAAADKLCTDVDCAGSLLQALRADMLVGVSVGMKDGRAIDVVVQLVDADAKFVNATVDVEQGTVADAANAAFQRAMSKWPVRHGVRLRVEGAPIGATVTVDGQPKGTLPLEARVQPGAHAVGISMYGYASEEHKVVATTTPGESVLVKVELQKDGSASRPVRWHLVGGSALVVAGLGSVLAGALPVLLKDDACEEEGPTGRCLQEERNAVAPLALWTGLGAAAVVGGVVWIVRGHRKAKQSTQRVAVGVGPTTLVLKGSF